MEKGDVNLFTRPRRFGETLTLSKHLELSIDSEGYGQLEKVSFDAYNESGCLVEAVERYKSRTGNYPERVLADQIYRTRDNRAYCKKHGIRLSGRNWGKRHRMPKQIRNGNIRITPTGLKWNGISAGANVAMAWDVS